MYCSECSATLDVLLGLPMLRLEMGKVDCNSLFEYHCTLSTVLDYLIFDVIGHKVEMEIQSHVYVFAND